MKLLQFERIEIGTDCCKVHFSCMLDKFTYYFPSCEINDKQLRDAREWAIFALENYPLESHHYNKYSKSYNSNLIPLEVWTTHANLLIGELKKCLNETNT